MSIATLLEQILELPVFDRIRIMEAIWDSISLKRPDEPEPRLPDQAGADDPAG